MKSQVYIINTMFYSKARTDILEIQGVLLNQNTHGGEIIVTGNVGKIGFEAMQVAKTLMQNLADNFSHNSYHLHFTYPTLAKEGSCCGLACFILLGFLTKKIKYAKNITAIGELDLLGNILSINHLCEKTTAWVKRERDNAHLLIPKSDYCMDGVYNISHVSDVFELLNNLEPVK